MTQGPLPDALTALEDAPCGLLQTDDDGLILWVNRTFCHWIAMDGGELVGQRRLQELFTMGGRIFHQTHWAPLLRMQGSISEVKLEVNTQGGPPLPMIMSAILRDRGGGRRVQEVAMYVARDRDKYERELVQSRRNLQEAVQRAEQLQAQSNDRALFAEQMVGIVSHDLRNPLSAIHMGALLLSRKGATPEQQVVLGRISRSTERANRMISDLLDFTQARVGKGLSLDRRRIDLFAVVHEAVDELKLAYSDRVLRHTHTPVTGDDDDTVVADPDRLSQLVGNLVSNAIAYGSPDQPVEVTSRVDAGTFTIAVHNFGPPIPDSLRETIFLPLTRGETTANASGRSVGLGLYIVSEIARTHGGSVSVRSTAETGTEFTAVFDRGP